MTRLKGTLVFLALLSATAAVASLHLTVSLAATTQTSFSTIQAAIDAAQAGTIIDVEPGVYRGVNNTNLRFRGKAITLRGVAGQALTILDCEGRQGCRLFQLEPAEAPAGTVIEGFTLRGGNINAGATGGGAVIAQNAHPTFINCIMTDPFAAFDGGCLYVWFGSITLRNVTMHGYSSNNEGGAARFHTTAIAWSEGRVFNNRAKEGRSSPSVIPLDESQASKSSTTLCRLCHSPPRCTC